MDISLSIHHHHEMHGKKHELIVKTNTSHSILELKQAILDQYPSKVNHFIAPTQFQQLILHGQILDNSQLVNDLILSSKPIETLQSDSNNNDNITNTIFPYHWKQGQIILIQFPRTDTHLRQLHDVITDPSNTLRPIKLSQKFKISIDRVMKIIYFLEASGFIQIDSSPPSHSASRRSSISMQAPLQSPSPEIPDFVEQRVHFSNFPRAQRPIRIHSAPDLQRLSVTNNGSIASNTSLSSGDHDRALMSQSILRTVVSELAAQILLSDDDEPFDDQYVDEEKEEQEYKDNDGVNQH